MESGEDYHGEPIALPDRTDEDYAICERCKRRYESIGCLLLPEDEDCIEYASQQMRTGVAKGEHDEVDR